MKVLLIDDDADDREIMLEALGIIDSSIKCMSAPSAERGLYLLDKHRQSLPDIIFLDINMPKVNGKECLKVLKQDDSYKNIKIVMLSTTSSQSEIDALHKTGADMFMAKPRNFKELVEELRTFFNTPASGNS